VALKAMRMFSGLTYVQVKRFVSALASSSSPPNSSIPGFFYTV